MNNQASSFRQLAPQFYYNFNLITINVQLQRNHLACSAYIFTLHREKSSSIFSMSELVPLKIVPLSESLLADVALERPHIGV
jgi:hypothetical protein